MRAQRACCVAGSASEVARRVTEGAAAGVWRSNLALAGLIYVAYHYSRARLMVLMVNGDPDENAAP